MITYGGSHPVIILALAIAVEGCLILLVPVGLRCISPPFCLAEV